MFCTQCGATVRDGLKFCTSCGAKVEDLSPADAQGAVSESTGPVPQQQVAQPVVAQPQPAVVVTQTAQESSGKINKIALAIAAAVAVLAVAALLVWFFVLRDGGDAQTHQADTDSKKSEKIELTEAPKDTEGASASSTEEASTSKSESSAPADPSTAEGRKKLLDDPNGMLLADSSTKTYSSSYFNDWSNWELCVARNEIYARHGYQFKSLKEAITYFNGKSWYRAGGYYEGILNATEKANVSTILAIEKNRQSPYCP